MKQEIVMGLACLSVVLAGCSQVQPGTQAIERDSWGSPTLGSCDTGPSNPGTMSVDLIRFPNRQITWDASDDKDAERGPYLALSKPADPPPPPPAPGQPAPPLPPDYSTGQTQMAIPVTLTFSLTTNCNDLKDFYTKYATQDGGYLNDDGTNSAGWIKMLNRVISQPAEQAIIRITGKYPWQKVWNDEGVRAEYQQALQNDLQKQTATRTGGKEYFTNFSVTVLKPYPTDKALIDAVQAQQSSQAQAQADQTKQTADANARKASALANTAAADAEVAAKQAEASKLLATISGYGTGPQAVENFLRDECIHTQGCTMYGPNPIIAGAPAH